MVNILFLKALRFFRFITKKQYTDRINCELIKTSVLFDEAYYLKQNPEVRGGKITPIEHYLKYGWTEGKNPSEKFDGNEYLSLYPDVKNAGLNPLLHYLKNGRKENRAYKDINGIFHIDKKGFLPNLFDIVLRNFKNKTPKISVIVASYNYADLITETLDSLVNQTYKNFEVIVVDDGSRDNSVDVIKKYVEKYDFIKLYTHEGNCNKGLPETLKLGLQKTTGKYIAFLESDDVWMPNCLEERVKFMNQYFDVPILSNGLELFGDKDSKYEIHIENMEKLLTEGKNWADLYKNLYSNYYIPTFSQVMIRKDVLLKSNFDSPISGWLDFWLYRQILSKYPLFYLKTRLTKWRIHNSLNCHKNDEENFKSKEEFIIKSELLIRGNAGKFPKKATILRQYKKIAKSRYFNAKWYVKKYKLKKNEDPILHYLIEGYKLDYDPSLKFSTKGYINFNTDLKGAGINPLSHYEMHGRKEGRMISSAEKKPVVYKTHIDPAKENVLLVTHMLNHTGAPMLLLSLANLLKENGYNVFVLSPMDGDLKKEFLKADCTVFIDRNMYFSDEQFEFYKNIKFKFCVCNTVCCTSAYAILKKHMPTILWIHDNIEEKTQKEIEPLICKSDNIYVPSNRTKAVISKCNHNPKILSYPIKDVAPSPLSKANNDTITIAVCASIEKRKGQDIFIEAIKNIPENLREKGRFLIVGEPWEKSKLKELKRSAKNISQIKFLHSIKDIKKYHEFMESIDVLCCPSREDPYPLVVIDALMHSKPAVISDHTGEKDIIENNKNGYIFQSENVQELSNILSKILQEGVSQEMKNGSRKLFEDNFEYQGYFPKFKEIMEKTCAE